MKSKMIRFSVGRLQINPSLIWAIQTRDGEIYLENKDLESLKQAIEKALHFDLRKIDDWKKDL